MVETREPTHFFDTFFQASKEKTLRAQKLEEGFMEDMAGVAAFIGSNIGP